MENFRLHFHKVPEEKKESIVDILKKDKNSGAQKFLGEYEKSLEELKIIDVFNNLIQVEIKALNVVPRDALTSERVHFINQDIANSIGLRYGGGYGVNEDNIVINKDFIKKRLGIYIAILHESLHYYSFNSLIVTGEKEDVKVYRSGYRSENILDSTTKHEHFRGLNEAIVERMTRDIVQKNRDFLIKEFNISNKEIEKENKHENKYGIEYGEEMNILDLLIKKMSKFYKKDPEEIWAQFKKGLFTGEMMHLRNIEEVFGPGSLRVLAAMTSKGSTKNINEEQIFENLKNFFEEENQEERNKIAKRILSERERLQYEKINKKN